MKVKTTEIADWAKCFAELMIDAKTYSKEKNIPMLSRHELLIKSAESVSNQFLNTAILEMAREVENTRDILGAIKKQPDVFDRWFISIFAYGMFYCELPQVLIRFAEQRDGLGVDYFNEYGGRCDIKTKGVWKPEKQQNASD